MSPQQIAGLLQRCNARELKELDDKLGGKLKDIVKKAIERRPPSGHRGHAGHAQVAPGTLATINNALFGMDDFRAEEKDLQLIDDAAKMDPRAHADVSTPQGMAQRMAWAATLPPEKRIKAFNALRKQVPVTKMSAQQVMGAYLNGEQGTQGGMLSQTLLDELNRIERLPPDERTEALKTFQAMTGRSPNDLRLAAQDTNKKLDFAKKVAEIEKLPIQEQLAKLTELAESSKMSVNELQSAYDDALKAGLIKEALKPVGKHVASELDRIKMIEDPEKRRAELSALAQANGLSQADVLGHLKARLEESRKKRRELAAHRKGAQKMDALFKKRDGEAIKKHLQTFAKDPAKLKQIAEQMGGMDKLREKLARQFGEGSNAFLDLDPVLDMADKHTAEPKLPDGTNADMASEINRIKKAGGDWQSALQSKYPDLTATDLSALEKHAEWSQKKMDLQVEHAERQFAAELDSAWVEDDRIKELVNRYPHDVLLALAEKMLPGRDLVEEIRNGVGADLSEDFTEKLNQARQLSKLPPEKRSKALTDARVAYKFDQLNEEFNAAVYADDSRIAELVKDCSPEELKRLNEKFEGKLESLLEANTGGPGGAEDAQTVRDTMRKLRNGEIDYSKPPDERFPQDDERVSAAYDEITSELSDVWSSDNDILGALKSLNPRELQALAKKFEEAGSSLLDAVNGGLDRDSYAQAVAMVDSAEEAMSGHDRQQEMKDRCRQLAIADRLKQLKKDPKHKGKSDFELYDIIDREGSRIDKMAADRVKKVRDSANDIFKAVDGWWNNDTDAMLKTMAGLAPEEVEMVKIEYRRHFGRDFDIDVRDEMGFHNREEMKVAEKLMSSDPEQRVAGLREYLLEGYRMFDVEDEQMIFDTLENMSVEERTLLVSGFEGTCFLEDLKADLGENEQKMVEALTHIDPKTGKADANPAIVAAAKMKMHIHGSGDWWDFSAAGTKEEELIAELDKLTPAQIRAAEAYYNQHLAEGGSTFIADMKGDFGDGRDWDIIEAEMRGDKVTADAHRIKWAAQEDNWIGGGTDEDLLEKTLKAGKEGRAGRDAAHLAKVRARFNNLFGGEGDRYGGDEDDSRDAFDRLIDDETHGIENIYFKELGQKGEARDEITLLYAMQGTGTDEDKLKEVLNKYYGKSPEERARFAALFQEQSRMLLGRDVSLEDWVESETSGAEGFDMKLLVMGKPTTPEEQLKIARMRWDFERGAGSGLGNAIMGIMDATGASSTSEVLAENMANLEALFDAEGKLVPGAEQRLEEVLAWQEQDTKNYRECKDSVADAVGETLAAVGAVAAGILTAGAAWYVMAAAAMAAAAAGTVFKAAIKGNSFGWEEGLQEMGAIAIAGVTAGLGGGAFKGLEEAAKAATTAFQKYALVALKGAIEGAIDGFLNAVLTSEQAWEGGDVAFLTHILKSTALGGFNGAAGELVGELLKDGPLGKQIERIENGNPAAHNAGKHYTLKYANGVVKAAATTAIDPANWEAWADGKEIGLADIKRVFVMPALSAAMETAKARNKGKTGAELETEAIEKVTETEAELAKLEAARAKAKDPGEIEALETKLRVMKLDLEEARSSRDFIIEDNKVLAERDAAKKRIEEGLDNESDGKMDALEEAGQTAAMRKLIENMDDASEIEVTSAKNTEDERSKGPRYEEVEGGPLEGQRKLDNTDRVIEREALATLRDTIIEDGMSKLADDPAAAMKVAHTIADLFDDKPGQAAVAKAIRFEDDPAKALQAAHDLNAFSKIVDIDPKDMTEDQLRTVAKAAYHLQKRQMDFLAVAEADGVEAARAKYPDLRMRRVEDMDAIGNILSQKWGNSIAGYVGEADNTAGMTSHQAIGALGLDYSGTDEHSGEFWHSPFLSQDGPYQRFSLDDRVAIVDFELTPDQIRAAKVTVHKDVVAQLEKEAQLPGQDGEWARKMLDRVHDNAEPDLYDADARDLENPHTGTGATRAGEAHMTWGDGSDPSTVNQEQKINPGSSDALPDGATVKILDEHGNLSPVAVMRNGKWQIADGAADLLPEAEFDAFKAKIHAQHDASHARQVAEISDAFGEDGSDLTATAKYRAKKRVQILDGAQGLDDPELRHAALEICERASTRELRVLVDAMDAASALAATDPAAAQALLRGALIDDDGNIKRLDDQVRGEMRQAREVRDENGAVVVDDAGNPVGGSFVIQFGFDGRVDRAEGEYQVTKKILLLGDDVNTDAVWGDITAGIDSVYGDAPRIDVPGDGKLKLKIQPQRMTLDDFPDAPDDPQARKAYFQERGIQVIAAHEGFGPADAANIYAGGAGGETDRMRQYIAAHEVTHGLGLPDTYKAATEELDGGYKLIVPDRQGDGAELVPDGGLMDSSSYLRPTQIEARPGETLADIVQRHGIDIAKNPWVADWIKSNNPQLVEGAMGGNLLLRPDLVAGETVTLPEFDLDPKGGLREHNVQWLEELVARSRGGEDLSDMDLQDTPWARDLLRDARQRAHEEGGSDGPFVANAPAGSRFSDDDGDRKQPIDTMTEADRARYLALMSGGSGTSRLADELEADNPTRAVPGLDPDDHEARLRVEMGLDEAPEVPAGPMPELSESAKVGGAMQAVLGLAAVTDDMSDHERASADRYRAILVHSMAHDDPRTQLAMLTIAYNGTEEHRRQLQVMLDSNPDPQTFDAWMAYLGQGVPELVWSSAPAASTGMASGGEGGDTAAPAPRPAGPEALDDVRVAKAGDLESLQDDLATGVEGLSGSRRKRAQDVVDILDHASELEDADLRSRALKLAVTGNAQDREELLRLLRKGEGELANGLAQVEASHQAWNQRQRAAQEAAKEAHPVHFAKVEAHLGTLVPPLPPELEADYILQSNEVVRRRGVDDSNFRLQVDEDGRLQVGERRGTPKPDHHAAYAGGLSEAEAARVVALMQKKGLTEAELAELRGYKRRSENLNPEDEAIVRNTKRFAEIVEGVMDGRLPFEALGELALLGADADAIVHAVARIEAASTEDKVAGSKALGELAGRYFMGRAHPDAVEVDGLCWDGNGTFDQIWETPTGEFIIVEAKGGGATNSSSVEVNGVRYQQGHPKYAEAILENMIAKHGKDPAKKAKLLALQAAWNAGEVRYLQVSQKVHEDGSPSSIDVREYAQYR